MIIYTILINCFDFVKYSIKHIGIIDYQVCKCFAVEFYVCFFELVH